MKGRNLHPEIALGFAFATLFWIVVLAWATSYAPTNPEKEACYQAAAKSGRDTHECESFWEKTTSDPVAMFTLVLALSTIGLWMATIGLYKSGQNQLRLTREAEKRELRAYIGHHSIHFENALAIKNGKEIIAPLGPVKYFDWNYGRTPALNVEMFVRTELGRAPEKLLSELEDADRQNVVQIVHPGQNLGRIVSRYTPDQTFFMYGYVDYDDIFNDRWRHRFAFSYDPERARRGGEAWVAHGSYNCEEYLGPGKGPATISRIRPWESSQS
jgi:hypothetical protein